MNIGQVDDDLCSLCGGTGLRHQRLRSFDVPIDKVIRGRWIEYDEFCPACGGSGRVAGRGAAQNAASASRWLHRMCEHQPCDGETFLGFTVKKGDRPATVHAYNTEHEQYDFCARHHYFYLYGHYPEDKASAEAGQDDGLDGE
jgi:hypothetical protein